MKKSLYYFGVIWGVVIITAFLIFTACQNSNSNKTSEPEICTSCHGDKTITCRSCLGKGRGLCSFCDGSKACNFCEDGYKYHREKCSFCTSGVIVNPFTWATYDCPKCDHGVAKVAEKCVFCDGTNECSHCDGTGLAGFCKDCQGRGKIDCTDCD